MPRLSNPYIALLASLLLPGSGHLILGKAQRGLMFIFFMITLSWISFKLMPPTASFFGRHGGGFLIYGFCALDAYKIARVKQAQEKFQSKQNCVDP